MRGPLPSLALVLGLVLVAVGCGSGSDSKKTATTPTPAAKAERQAETQGPRSSTTQVAATPRRVASPRRVEVSGKSAAAAVEKVLGEDVQSGQPTVIGARCKAGRCVVRYRSQPRGGGAVAASQQQILRGLFARPDVQSVVLYVHHQSVGTPEKNEAPAFATARCRRTEQRKFVCRSTHVAGGRQRSLVRRGLLSNQEASQGKGEPPGR